MAKREYLTAPLPSEKMPAGIPYILANEAAERFAFYGMSSILVVFMTKYLMGSHGLDVMGDEKAKEWFHTFTAAVYFTPLIGALLSDGWLGKYRTILFFSVVYCVGMVALAWDHTRLGLGLGMVLIALGSGIIKPCVTANVGDQFGQRNKHLISKMYAWFYFAINLGACASMFLCPLLLDRYGPRIGFGVPAVLMVFATVAFFLGRAKYVHIPPAGEKLVNELGDKEIQRILARLAVIFVFVSMFFALFYQSQGAWVLQAEKMDLKWLGITWLPAQVQFINSFFIMIMIPLASYLIYPSVSKVVPLTPLRKIGAGMLVTAVCFIVPAWIETQIQGGDVFKCTSRSTITGLEPLRLIDGLTDDGSRWSSATAPSSEAPQEVVIRLRERKAWRIDGVAVWAQTHLSRREIAADLDQLLTETLREGVSSNAPATADVNQSLEIAPAQTREVIAAVRKADNVEEAKSIAAGALAELEIDTGLLEDEAYQPRNVSLFAGDFRGRLVPVLYSGLPADEKETAGDAREYAVDTGWTHVGDYVLDPNEGRSVLQFEPTTATHVLVQIKSNYGGDRVKIAEIEVVTTDPVPTGSKAITQRIWPNVAALGYRPSIGWQFFAYLLLTAGEILASISVLEFSYTQAPKKVKSFVMSLYLLSISLGNVFSAVVNHFIQNPDGSTKLPGASYYWFFAIAMVVTLALYIPVAMRFPVREYIQDEAQPGG
ncbi:MAG: MFS transporter [Sedimentisphaerales bacterium]|nr:MFS transporter [Sedimentisphaerales bacterium]